VIVSLPIIIIIIIIIIITINIFIIKFGFYYPSPVPLSLSTNDPITPALFSEVGKLLYPTSVAVQVEQCLP
jgi:hypothetical protein